MKSNSKNKAYEPRQRFKELRKAKGTQRQVAHEMGVTENTVRAMEAGYYKPNLENINAFAIYFGTDVYDLFPDIFQRPKTDS